jgi:putative sigma-54 modulation protein
MKIKIHSIRFDADQKLLAFVQEKVDRLLNYYEHILDGEVYLKIDADSVENKIVEIKVNAPGKTLFAKEQKKTFEEATSSAFDALKKQVQKHKEKIRGL